MVIERMIASSGWPLITNDMVNLFNLDWLNQDGVPDRWVTLFGKVFESPVVQRRELEFDNMQKAELIKEWINSHGFANKMKYHLHRTVCIDVDLDAYLVEWHLSFPSDSERIAWMLSMDWETHIDGWN